MEKLSMCRICLAEDGLRRIVDTHLQEMYESLVMCPLQAEDSRPIHACYICLARLRNCYALRKSCRQSEELFTQMLSYNVQPKLTPEGNKNRLTIDHHVVQFSISDELHTNPDVTTEPSELHVEVTFKEEFDVDEAIENRAVEEDCIDNMELADAARSSVELADPLTIIKKEPEEEERTTSHDESAPQLDIEPVSKVEPVVLLDIEPAIPEDLDMSERCINCGKTVTEHRRHKLKLIDIREVIGQWIAPQVATPDSIVCHSCFTRAMNVCSSFRGKAPHTSGQHRQLCINCWCSILRTRSHTLHTKSEREARVLNIISEWVTPRQVHVLDRICHPCWQRADRASIRAAASTASANVPNYLPDYTRAPVTQASCFCPDCDSPQRLHVPVWLRIKLFIDHNFYVPKNCRVCSFHLQSDNWGEIIANISNPIHTFTEDQIQDFKTFVNE